MHLLTTMLDHQQAAVDKLLRLRVGGLFMDMGTGKTRTLIEIAARRSHKIDKVVVFCPVALISTWNGELEKHIDSPRIYPFGDRTKQGKIPDAEWYLIGVESMGQSTRIALAANDLITEKTFVVIDESDTCKNHVAKRTRRITSMSAKAKYRMILTGTPVAEGVVDLYSQLYFLSPEILGYKSFYSFARNHLEYSDKHKGMIVRSLNTEWIAKKIEPYIYQVKKDECLDLPDKLFNTYYCELSTEQNELYWQAKEEILNSCPDEDIDSYTIFRLFTALREIVSGFWNRATDPEYYWSSRSLPPEFELLECTHARIDALLTAVSRIPSNEKIIIWSNFHYSTQQIEKAIASEYGTTSYSTYHGLTEDRDREIEQWRTTTRFLIASPKCGGRGLTLVESAYQLFYNNDFPYRLRLQAEDRIHRIGQTRKPTYIDIVASNSIDQRIVNALAKKESLSKAFKRELDKLKTAKERKDKLLQL